MGKRKSCFSYGDVVRVNKKSSVHFRRYGVVDSVKENNELRYPSLRRSERMLHKDIRVVFYDDMQYFCEEDLLFLTLKEYKELAIAFLGFKEQENGFIRVYEEVGLILDKLSKREED